MKLEDNMKRDFFVITYYCLLIMVLFLVVSEVYYKTSLRTDDWTAMICPPFLHSWNLLHHIMTLYLSSFESKINYSSMHHFFNCHYFYNIIIINIRVLNGICSMLILLAFNLFYSFHCNCKLENGQFTPNGYYTALYRNSKIHPEISCLRKLPTDYLDLDQFKVT